MSATDITGHFSNFVACDVMRPPDLNAGVYHVMGHIWPLVFSGFVCLGILQIGFKGLSTLAGLSERANRMWTEEYQLRRCIFREAARKNIFAASRVLAATFPERRTELEDQNQFLSDELSRLYPEDDANTVVGEGTCCSQREPLCFSLYLESHSGQPTPWPNYVPRLSI